MNTMKSINLNTVTYEGGHFWTVLALLKQEAVNVFFAINSTQYMKWTQSQVKTQNLFQKSRSFGQSTIPHALHHCVSCAVYLLLYHLITFHIFL